VLDWLKRRSAGASTAPSPPRPFDSRLPFPAIVVPGRAALDERRRRLESREVTPVLMGSPDDARRFGAALAVVPLNSTAEVRAAATVDLARWFAQRVESDPDFHSVAEAAWPDTDIEPTQLSVHLESAGGPLRQEVVIGLVPTSRSWEVPAFVGFGGWNECPEGAVHVAIHEKWHRDYGSDVASLTSDVIECTVERLPGNRTEAMQLAREQFLYCPDLVHQGTQSLEQLAALLMYSKVWYFWWD
jgi:hypothetical protein